MSVRLPAVRYLVVVALGLFPVLPLMVEAADPATGDIVGFDGNPGEGFRLVGAVKPRHARDIKLSNCSVGAETMDRDFTIYTKWEAVPRSAGRQEGPHPERLGEDRKGEGKVRLGVAGRDHSRHGPQGVEPWVCLCYGNPIYEGGGGTGLGRCPPRSTRRSAWDRYVAAFVDRYKKHVDEWEIWNEPRGGKGEAAVQYAKLVIRTAEVIRAKQPKARIFFAAGGSFDVPYAQQVLEHLKQEGKLDLVNKVIYHPYSVNPDKSYAAGRTSCGKIAASFAPHIDIYQGENGAPLRGPARSGQSPTTAGPNNGRRSGPCGGSWATWDATSRRRISRSATWRTRRTNYKGLLAINHDKTVNHVKQAYYALQNMFAIFDGSLARIADFKAEVAGNGEKSTYAVFGYRGDAEPVVTLWRHSDSPGERPDAERLTVTLAEMKFVEPVYVDLLSGKVYAIDPKQWSTDGDKCVFRNVAAYDSPVVIAERGAIPLK